jgi:hypothetical protein
MDVAIIEATTYVFRSFIFHNRLLYLFVDHILTSHLTNLYAYVYRVIQSKRTNY